MKRATIVKAKADRTKEIVESHGSEFNVIYEEKGVFILQSIKDPSLKFAVNMREADLEFGEDGD